MIVHTPERGRVRIEREPTDPRYGKRESLFYAHLRNKLKAMGYDAIKKRAWKDGHLVCDDMFVVRARNSDWVLYDSDYAYRLVTEPFDQKGEVHLSLEGDMRCP